jgi:hypothetical protein
MCTKFRSYNFYAWYTYCIYVQPRIIVILILIFLIIKMNLKYLGILKDATFFVIYTNDRKIAFTNLKRVNSFLCSVDVS